LPTLHLILYTILVGAYVDLRTKKFRSLKTSKKKPAINGLPIKNSSDFYNYININNKSVGDKVVLTTMHDGVTRNFTITLGKMPSPF
jgi:PDZ domain-containing secreted protein